MKDLGEMHEMLWIMKQQVGYDIWIGYRIIYKESNFTYRVSNIISYDIIFKK